jgi:hypothetical protein
MQASVTQEVGTLIDKLADKLAVPTAKLWAVLTQQARIEAVHDGIVAVIWLAVGVMVIVCLTVVLKRLRDEELADPVFARGLIRFVRTVIPSLCFVVAINNGVVAWKRSVNPEYYAVQEILSVLKPAK